MRALLYISIAALAIAGCSRNQPSSKPPLHFNQNMDEQPKFKPQAVNKFFADGRSMRMPVEGTVPRGWLREDSSFYYEGRDNDSLLLKISPLPYTAERLERGRERYDIFCAPCHGKVGDGRGIITQKGLVPPASFHEPRLRDIEDGHLFEVMSDGLRNMPPYKYQVDAADRWAIIAYLRALQRSQNATRDDLPTGVLPAHKERVDAKE